jgi:hypothetical protein
MRRVSKPFKPRLMSSSDPVAGQQVLTVSLGRDPGGDEATVRMTGRPDRLLGASDVRRLNAH